VDLGCSFALLRRVCWPALEECYDLLDSRSVPILKVIKRKSVMNKCAFFCQATFTTNNNVTCDTIEECDKWWNVDSKATVT
jgi:hypothetical protein